MKITQRIKNITRGLERATAPEGEDEPALEIRIGEITGSVLVKFGDDMKHAYAVSAIARRYPASNESSESRVGCTFYENDFDCYEQVFDVLQSFVKKLAEET